MKWTTKVIKLHGIISVLLRNINVKAHIIKQAKNGGLKNINTSKIYFK